jgi:hypothetical protein
MMNLDAFKASLAEPVPPAVSVPLQALWHDAHGDWHRAHDLLQDDNSPAGSWVHAYLHRKEPDLANAAYWYRRAGKAVASGSLEEEWDTVASALLSE